MASFKHAGFYSQMRPFQPVLEAFVQIVPKMVKKLISDQFSIKSQHAHDSIDFYNLKCLQVIQQAKTWILSVRNVKAGCISFSNCFISNNVF